MDSLSRQAARDAEPVPNMPRGLSADRQPGKQEQVLDIPRGLSQLIETPQHHSSRIVALKSLS